MLSQEYIEIQRLVRQFSREQARKKPSAFRNPQNNSEVLRSYFKPRVNILIRPPFIKTGLDKSLKVGSGEVLFHVHGPVIDGIFYPNPDYRIVVGSCAPIGFLEMIECNLGTDKDIISERFQEKKYDLAVEEVYSLVRKSLINLYAYQD